MILLFGYFLRLIYQFAFGEFEIQLPDFNLLFSLLVIFSYFTLFAPLLHLRVIYDEDAMSRREVALNAPVKAKEMLSGNLLSNLAFFLPFFGFIGTLVLSPFMGSGFMSPLLTSLLLFMVLSLLIIIGLVSGTLLSPVIFYIISKQRSDRAKGFVTLLTSIALISALPLLQYLIGKGDALSSLDIISFLPFTLAASIILYVLYGVVYGLPPLLALIILLGYITVILLLGWRSADNLYSLHEGVTRIHTSDPNQRRHQFVNRVTSILPSSHRTLTRNMIRGSFRDVDHISQLGMGISLTIFTLFALSTRGLFVNGGLPDGFGFAVTIFALFLSSTTVIYIEASIFIIQHKEMLTMIKSAPNGSRKFLEAKLLQIIYTILPIYLAIILALPFLGMITFQDLPVVFFLFIIYFFFMNAEILAIYMINPIDEQEDLNNLLNVIFFYITTYALAVIPIAVLLSLDTISIWFILIFAVILGVLGVILFGLAVKSLENMNLETLSSELSERVMQGLKAFLLFMLGTLFIPAFAVFILIFTQNFVLFIFFSNLFILLLPSAFWLRHKLAFPSLKMNLRDIKMVSLALPAMLLISFIIVLLLPSPGINLIFTVFEGIQTKTIILLITLLVIVEELFFRGFIWDYLRRKLTWKQTLVLSSVLFSFAHVFPLASVINGLILGFILGYMRHKSGSVMPPIVAHLIFNLTAFILS